MFQYLHNPLKQLYNQGMCKYIFNYISYQVTLLNIFFFNLKTAVNSKNLDVYLFQYKPKFYRLKNIMAIKKTIDIHLYNQQMFYKNHFEFFSLCT